MKLGLLGVTFLYSSGDFGVAGNEGMFVVLYVPEARTRPSLIPAILPPGHCMNKKHHDVVTGGTVVHVSSYDEWNVSPILLPFFPQVQPYVP